MQDRPQERPAGVPARRQDHHVQNADGSLVEQGNALMQPNGLTYHYVATTGNTTLAGDKIIITASDSANSTHETRTL